MIMRQAYKGNVATVLKIVLEIQRGSEIKLCYVRFCKCQGVFRML
jgi:hypothetical protein